MMLNHLRFFQFSTLIVAIITSKSLGSAQECRFQGKLLPTQSLFDGECVCAGDYAFCMDSKSGLSLSLKNSDYPQGYTIWSTNVADANLAKMRRNGNLVMYNRNVSNLRTKVWSSGTPNNNNAYFELNKQGFAQILMDNSAAIAAAIGADINKDKILWVQYAEGCKLEDPQDILRSGERLFRGQYICRDEYRFGVDNNGNTGVFHAEAGYGDGITLESVEKMQVMVWDGDSSGEGFYVHMQKGGNLVVYDDEIEPEWNSNTGGNPGAQLEILENGKVQVVSRSTDIISP